MNRYYSMWPVCSPDSTIHDFYLLVFLNETVYEINPYTLDKLMANIQGHCLYSLWVFLKETIYKTNLYILNQLKANIKSLSV